MATSTKGGKTKHKRKKSTSKNNEGKVNNDQIKKLA